MGRVQVTTRRLLVGVAILTAILAVIIAGTGASVAYLGTLLTGAVVLLTLLALNLRHH